MWIRLDLAAGACGGYSEPANTTHASVYTNVPPKLHFFPGIPCGNFPGPGAGHHMTQASFNPIKEFIHHTDEHITKGFEDFIVAHNKKYEHDKEVMKRLEVFRHNFRFIHSKNRQGLTYRLAVNHLTDRTDDERRVS